MAHNLKDTTEKLYINYKSDTDHCLTVYGPQFLFHSLCQQEHLKNGPVCFLLAIISDALVYGMNPMNQIPLQNMFSSSGHCSFCVSQVNVTSICMQGGTLILSSHSAKN